MSLRISEVVEGNGTTLRVDGRLLADDVGELWRASDGASPPLTLELSGLLFADGEGVDALRQLSVAGAELRNVPPYVSLLLGMRPTSQPSRAASGPRPRTNEPKT